MNFFHECIPFDRGKNACVEFHLPPGRVGWNIISILLIDNLIYRGWTKGIFRNDVEARDLPIPRVDMVLQHVLDNALCRDFSRAHGEDDRGGPGDDVAARVHELFRGPAVIFAGDDGAVF
jgi:hypothetical protein